MVNKGIVARSGAPHAADADSDLAAGICLLRVPAVVKVERGDDSCADGGVRREEGLSLAVDAVKVYEGSQHRLVQCVAVGDGRAARKGNLQLPLRDSIGDGAAPGTAHERNFIIGIGKCQTDIISIGIRRTGHGSAVLRLHL